MEDRVALISIIIKDSNSVNKVNDYLHAFNDKIIARMGIPYPKRKVALISVIIDAPQQDIAALSGKIGALKGVSCKSLYSNLMGDCDED